MTDFLLRNPLLVLFLVLGLGNLLGRVRLGGFSLGVSGVLFVGLGIGALHRDLGLPEPLYLFGLVLFVYSLGISAGPGFVASLRRRGLSANLAVSGSLVAAGMVAVTVGRVAGLSKAVISGLFCGALTNTPALATVLEHQSQAFPGVDAAVTDPVVGYSVAYPFGVLGMILAVWMAHRLWDRNTLPGGSGSVSGSEELVSRTAVVVEGPTVGMTVTDLFRIHGWQVVFSRLSRQGEVAVVRGDTCLLAGDLVTVVGTPGDVSAAIRILGEESPEALTFSRRELDFRRIFVSESYPIGQRIADLRLPERFGAVITRVQRGDTDRLARADMVLEPGDRIRVVAPRHRMPELTVFFGDSYRRLSEIDVAAFSLGVTGGMLLGLVPIPLPGGATFKLGMAGGPLLVGLVLGALRRTGPITWQLSYNASLTLRQLGVVLFLAGVGTRSGYAFVDTIRHGRGLLLVAAGAAVTTTAALAMLFLGHRVLRVPVPILAGIIGGLQTQPAVLAFAAERSGNDLPNTGYATVYPVATVMKIVLAQLLLLFAA